MEEVLSQAEIDMLLNAMSSGEMDAEEIRKEFSQEKVRTYDFRRPNKFSKDQLRTLHMIHDHFARLLSNFLSAYLRTSIQIKIASVDQLTYEDFILSVPTPTLMTIFSMEPLNGTAILETNPAFFFPTIDLLFGGRGTMIDEKDERELTDIERTVLRKLNAKILDNLAIAWSDIFEFTPKIESLETNPQFNQIISPSETVALVTLTSNIGSAEGYMNICLPYITLEAVISKLSAQYWFSNTASKQQENYVKLARKNLSNVPVEVTAVCGETYITVRDFLQLQKGDSLILDQPVNEDLDILIEGRKKMKAQPGLKGNNLAVQITAVEIEGVVADE
ncbi:MAG: flagellar motor switch protein FliM [Thermoanaerobacteraceae bacterium]|nr:flagellar motor switch protein FliM [Thermoanaerobacteraceae bacterium]